MKNWSRSRESCLNCKSINRKHKAKGYCTKCYPFVRRIAIAGNWNLNDDKTLLGYPKTPSMKNAKIFARVKRGLIMQWQERLDWLRYREEELQSDIDGQILEYGFRRVARLAGVRNDLFHGLAGWFEFQFNLEQRKAIFTIIDRIEQEVGWEGINWDKVFESTR